MKKKFVRSLKTASILTTLSLACLSPLQAQEETKAPFAFVPHSQDKQIIIHRYSPEWNEAAEMFVSKGYYQIIVSPLYSVDAKQNKTACSDLSLTINSNIKDYFFDQVLKFKTAQFNASQGVLSEKACLDLNDDKNPELIIWGNESESKEKFPLILTSDSDGVAPKEFQLIQFALSNNAIHEIKLRPIKKDSWLQLILLDTSKAQDYKEIILRPMSFDPESKEYVPTTFIYDGDTEIAFSTVNKQLADTVNFNFSEASEIKLNRSGDLIGYIHGEGQANTGYFIEFLASFDIKSKKFRHVDIWNHPDFKKAVNQKYPGFLKRAWDNASDGSPIQYKVLGFQKRDLIFKAHVYDMGANASGGDNRFCGYWKFNVDTGKIGIVSWDPGAALNIEHTGHISNIIRE